VNLGNTAPLRMRSQLVVIHDAGVFATPSAYSWKFRLWYKLSHRRLARSPAGIVTVSEFGRQELVRFLGVSADAIDVISEGADHMDDIVSDPAVLDKIPAGRFVLVVGNLAAHKNLAALSELASRLADRDVRLVITGGLAKGAFQTSGQAPLPQPACYIGRVSDNALKALYQNAICLVFPSLYEGFGLPAVEAMACGCPLAASDIPALRETCGDAALYFNPLVPGDIAEQVCRLVDDTALREDLRLSAQAHVRRFTWERAATALTAIADRYVGNVCGPRP
jgi:glycosyltransferase involved in cell wall biosynthesis